MVNILPIIGPDGEVTGINQQRVPPKDQRPEAGIQLVPVGDFFQVLEHGMPSVDPEAACRGYAGDIEDRPQQ